MVHHGGQRVWSKYRTLWVVPGLRDPEQTFVRPFENLKWNMFSPQLYKLQGKEIISNKPRKIYFCSIQSE